MASIIEDQKAGQSSGNWFSSIRVPGLNPRKDTLDTQPESAPTTSQYYRAHSALEVLSELDLSRESAPEVQRWEDALATGALAQLSYINPPQVNDMLDKAGFEGTFISQGNVQALVAVERESGKIFVAFRGTDEARDGDIAVNFNGFRLIDHPAFPDQDVNIHRGYMEAMLDGAPNVMEQIDTAIAGYKTGPEQMVYVTGHSAGGAYAGIYSLYDAAKGTPQVEQTTLFNPSAFSSARISDHIDTPVYLYTGEDDILTKHVESLYRSTNYTRPTARSDWEKLSTENANSIDASHSVKYMFDAMREERDKAASAEQNQWWMLSAVQEIAQDQNLCFAHCDTEQTRMANNVQNHEQREQNIQIS